MTEVNEKNRKLWAVGMHLSVFSGYLVPLAGLVVPIVLWQWKKEEMPELDAHGKEITNFLLTFMLYGLVVGLLCFLVVGLFLLVPWMVWGVVLPIVGAIKAGEGVLWRYPFIIRFLR
jgi:uncharacterized Tic20 family protein